MTSNDQFTVKDPTEEFHSDDFPDENIEHPGLTTDMTMQPDHGEQSYRGTARLRDRRAIITGGDSGIGRAIAIAFAREGADVALAYLPEEEDDARETARWVTEAGRRVITVPTDLQEERNCDALITHAVGELGGIDIVINNAAYQMSLDQGLESLTTAQLLRTYRTNIFAMFWVCRAALPHLEPGSSIINTASIQAFDPSPQLIDYASTKAAIVNFTKCLALQAAERGIRVNAVAPGPIWTPLIPATMPNEKAKTFGQETPVGRAGQPAEVAPAYVFLASQESSYVTGEVIGVTGGQLTPA